MKTRTERWTIAIAAAAAIMAAGAPAFGQAAPPSQPPAAAQPAQPEQTPAPPQKNASPDIAKSHLTAARNTLSQLTQLPAAAQLQGDARMQVSQLINNFNELITTQADWKASYAKVESNLNKLLQPQAPDAAPPATTPGAVGTSGTVAIDPAIRTKLVEFRSHLQKFEDAAGAPSEPAAAEPAAAPTAQTAAAATPPPTPPTSQTPPATQTPPTTATPPTAQAAPAQDAPSDVSDEQKDILNHVEAIEVILGANVRAQAQAQSAAGGMVGTTGNASGNTRTTITPSDVTLNQSQLQELRMHLAELRRLLEKK